MSLQEFRNYPEIVSLNGHPKKLMVLLHGLGSDGDDLISLVPYIQNQLPDYHFISPHGIEAYDMAPYGRQWFSFRDRNPDIVYKLFEQNIPRVRAIIKAKQQELGLKDQDTVLCGFSQGTMVSIYLTLTNDQPYAATICFSGRLIAPKLIKNTKTPFCIIHGEDDQILPVEESFHIAHYLDEHKIQNQILTTPYLAHSIDDKGLSFALRFLKNLK
jgi:phospholipase/carboxylesterase